ncbi:hypothetical protein RRG08_014511 [Elysia crispata]|uniref:Uncharacterized protein n=1 Tax=Elysia crispata TaxID=231223 RepID=A0AAE1E6N7_9GAST|nr:hypothetical protein RRG08_014511 [Elysia crispata]
MFTDTRRPLRGVLSYGSLRLDIDLTWRWANQDPTLVSAGELQLVLPPQGSRRLRAMSSRPSLSQRLQAFDSSKRPAVFLSSPQLPCTSIVCVFNLSVTSYSPG